MSTQNTNPTARHGDNGLRTLAKSLRYAGRRLLKKPGFTLTAILSLAIGIGANVAIFSLVNEILLRKVPLREPERLVDIFLRTPDFPYNIFSYPDFDDLRDGTEGIFEGVLASRFAISQTERDGSIETLTGHAVTGNYFGLLGVDMEIGRPLLPEDDIAPGAHAVVVLGYDYWQKAYGGDSSVVGRDIRLSGRNFQIVGVAPATFTGNMRGIDPAFYAPRMMVNILQGNDYDELRARGNHSNFVKGRLRPGVTMAQAQTVLDGLAEHQSSLDLDNWDPQTDFHMVPTNEVLLYPPIDRFVRASAWLLSAVVGLILLMACTNLAGFLLAQAVDRKKEIALRMALGATRRNLIGQLLGESLLLAFLGGAAGIAVSVGLLRLLTGVDLPLPVPITLDLGLDLTVLGYTLGITILAGLALGLAPALQSSRVDVASTLKQEGAGGGQPGKLTLRNVLIGVQVAISTVLLVGAGLFLRSLQETATVDPGFGSDPAAVLTMLVPGTRFSEDEGRRYLDQLFERFERIPGVSDVGLAVNLHLNTLSTSGTGFNVDGVEAPEDREGHFADATAVDAGFFAATGIRITRGRNFNDHDLSDARKVAIINETLASRFFPIVDPVGRMLRMGDDEDSDLLIVGVASNAKIRTLGEAPRNFIYTPFTQSYSSFVTVVARTSADPSVLAIDMLGVARNFDPDFWAWETKTMERHLGTMLLPARLSALVLSAFAVIAIALAAIGLYGVVAYAVSQRTREIGIRLSIGADTASVVRLLMSTGLRPVLWGSLCGLALSLAVSRLLGGLLFGVGTLDPVSFLSATALLIATALLAALLPAMRAARVNPATALHFE